MSRSFVQSLISEVMRGLRNGARSAALGERCFLVVSRHSGRGAVACVGRNTAPKEEPTPELQALTRALWPEGAPEELAEVGGGIELVRILAMRLELLVRASSSGRTPRVSHGWRAEELCF